MAADLEKGDSSASPSAGGGGAAAGSVGLEYIIPAIIAAICFIGWVCANLQLQSSGSTTAIQVISFSVAPLVFQATTFAVAATLAWYASSYGNATYALLASIFNWIVVCCWLIYIEPNYGFFFWKTSFLPNSVVTFDCFSNTLDTNSCNSYKASSIFSIFIVTINFAWFVIYLVKGISAIRFSAGLKSIFTILGFLNLLGYLLWLAGQLRMTDKFSATTDTVTGAAMSYIITFMVGACTLLMFATANDEMGGSLNALNLIWHPLTAAIIWSNVISFARATDGKYGNTNVKDDAGKTIAAGIFMMAVAETVASILSLVSKFL